MLWHTRRGFASTTVVKARVGSQDRGSIDREATEVCFSISNWGMGERMVRDEFWGDEK